VGVGSPIGSDGAGWYDLSMKDLYEPFSCDVAGHQFVNCAASFGGIAPKASRAFQPPTGAGSDAVEARFF